MADIKKVNENKPVLTLNMDDKIYLAVAKNDLDKLSFVYTLACLKPNKVGRTYDLIATREIYTFKNPEAAKIYYDTIEQIVEFNFASETHKILFETNKNLIESFNMQGEKAR